MSTSTLSWFLFPFSIIGFLMGSEKNRWGWALCIFTQVVWLGFAWEARLPGIMPGSAAWLLMYTKNFFGWEWKWLARIQRIKFGHSPDRQKETDSDGKAQQEGLEPGLDDPEP